MIHIVAVMLGVCPPSDNPTFTQFLSHFWKHTHTSYVPQSTFIMCYFHVYLFIFKLHSSFPVTLRRVQETYTYIGGVFRSERWPQEGLLWKEIWGSDREKDGGWGEKRDGGGEVCMCFFWGGALLICPLIGLFKRWGRGTHQLYEEREEKQRERWEGGFDRVHFLHTNIQG